LTLTNNEVKNVRLLVVGDLIIDHYFWGNSSRISPEAPVPVVEVHNQSLSLGGAGNVVKNIRSLGANVDILSVVGDCEISEELRLLLKKEDVSDKYLITEGNRKSSKKTRVISQHQQVMRYDIESTDPTKIESERKLIAYFEEIINNYDLVLLSDYGKGVCTDNLTKSIIDISNRIQKKVLIDPKGKNYKKYSNAYLLTPNIKEASEACGISVENDKSLLEALKFLKTSFKLTESIITLSERGIGFLKSNKLRIFPTKSRDVYDVTGAGDTVLAALGIYLAKSESIADAIKFANLAATIVVGKLGSESVTLEEISNLKNSSNIISDDSNEIIQFAENIRNQDKKVVFTNGCFDIIHTGHVSYLEKAKELGDILIVGVNSDNSIKRIKGNSRPIINENDRAKILSMLKPVDYVVIFNEDTPYKLIEIIKPNILVKGGDYKKSEIIGSDIVQKVQTLDFIKGYSTSNIINKIKSL